MAWQCPHCDESIPDGDPHYCSPKMEEVVEKIKHTVKGDTVEADKAPAGAPTKETLADGQHTDHYCMSEEDRAKGRIRPYRERYLHVGMRPKHPTRPLTKDEEERFGDEFCAFEQYPEERSPATGRYWTQKELQAGCGEVTTMPVKCAETYAVDPSFYGSTFCCGCGDYYPVREFVWTDDNTVVGS